MAAGDPPSGRFPRRGGDDLPSPRHVDHTRETTRPGPHVEAGDFADEPTPIREFHRLDVRPRSRRLARMVDVARRGRVIATARPRELARGRIAGHGQPPAASICAWSAGSDCARVAKRLIAAAPSNAISGRPTAPVCPAIRAP